MRGEGDDRHRRGCRRGVPVWTRDRDSRRSSVLELRDRFAEG